MRSLGLVHLLLPLVASVIWIPAAGDAVAATPFTVDAELPAGNIRFKSCTGDRVTLENELRDTNGWWFYWAFRARGGAGRRMQFSFANGQPVGTRGPAVSTDRGATWSYGASRFDNGSFTYSFPKDAQEVWFSMGIPYTQRHWEAFLARQAGRRERFETGVLCTSKKGRAVEKIRLGRLDGKAKYRFVLTCRHHCCEMTPSYVLEGALAAMLGDDELGRWYRENVEVTAVPFVDKDGVEDGDQGKNRRPWDHCRDYNDDREPIHPEVAALKRLLADGRRTDVIVDHHGPWIRGGACNERIYQVGVASEKFAAAQVRFGLALEAVQTGGCAYAQANDLAFGKDWNTGANYTKGSTLVQWATRHHTEASLVTSFEIPFANVDDITLDEAKFRAFGRDMAMAYRAFLEEREVVSASGIYPHLAMSNDEGECGTGAVVPWAGRLWVVTYGPHCPVGSSDKLYEIRPDLTRVTRPESVGGTPAERLIHRETGKLLIGQYLIDSEGRVETVWISRMPGRLTGAARHLTEPARKIYVTDMEEALYELDVTDPAKTFTLIRDGHNRAAFEGFFRRWHRTPPPGWNEAEESTLFGYHGKGTCSGFGKVFYANNGMNSPAAMRDPRTPSGCLAQWRPGMKNWELVRTNQFTEITTRDGLYGNEHPSTNPIWALGWDHRSVILATTADGETWHDYRLPKGSHSYDGAHGWNTEWPRIREIGEGADYLATMHGTFWRFPANFAPGRAAGVRPRSTYLKVIGDFCRWGERVVFGCDDHAKSEFLNVRALKGKRARARRSESNLWFVEPSRLDALGPREGRGAVWSGDAVAAGAASDPFLFAGYDRRWLWLTVPAEVQVDVRGDGVWTPWKTLAAGGHDLAAAPAGEWVRLVAKQAATNAFAVFHYQQNRTEPKGRPFAQTAPAAAAGVFADDAPIPSGLIQADAASLVYVDGGVRRRLPRRTAASTATCGRLCREVSTERDLLHVGEIFYELPADNAGGFRYVHPVAATARPIRDYDTWKGCLVLREGDALKIGAADDLWVLGKPVGVGGPWRETRVAANEPSDAYLMNGFDRKTLMLRADADVTVTLEADVDGCGTWVVAGRYAVAAARATTVELPEGFSAYWVRVRADRACTASAQFLYH